MGGGALSRASARGRVGEGSSSRYRATAARLPLQEDPIRYLVTSPNQTKMEPDDEQRPSPRARAEAPATRRKPPRVRLEPVAMQTQSPPKPQKSPATLRDTSPTRRESLVTQWEFIATQREPPATQRQAFATLRETQATQPPPPATQNRSPLALRKAGTRCAETRSRCKPSPRDAFALQRRCGKPPRLIVVTHRRSASPRQPTRERGCRPPDAAPRFRTSRRRYQPLGEEPMASAFCRPSGSVRGRRSRPPRRAVAAAPRTPPVSYRLPFALQRIATRDAMQRNAGRRPLPDPPHQMAKPARMEAVPLPCHPGAISPSPCTVIL